MSQHTERRYWVSDPGGNDPRRSIYIETQETYYCGDPECEAQHDDPEAKWDSRTIRCFAETYRREDAERIVSALKSESDQDSTVADLRERLESMVKKHHRITKAIDAALGTSSEQRQAATGQAGVESAVTLLLSRLPR